jgi:hypothetical protein
MWLVPPLIQPVYSLEIEKMEADDPLLLQENEAEVSGFHRNIVLTLTNVTNK